MARGYWITFYRSVSNPAALAEYAGLAAPAIQAAGGRFLARGVAAEAFEAGLQQRSVLRRSASSARAAWDSRRDAAGRHWQSHSPGLAFTPPPHFIAASARARPVPHPTSHTGGRRGHRPPPGRDVP